VERPWMQYKGLGWGSISLAALPWIVRADGLLVIFMKLPGLDYQASTRGRKRFMSAQSDFEMNFWVKERFY